MSLLPKLYDMRIVYDDTEVNEWYGPYALTDEDIREMTPTVRLNKRTVEIREHKCDEPVNGGCGHMQEGLPAPY